MLENAIESALERSEVPRDQHLLLGVSGGADSMALLHACCSLRKDPLRARAFSVVHVEHGLRGKASLQDAEFVREVCEGNSVPFHLVQVNAAEEAQRRGGGVQEAARHLRYAAFGRLAQTLGAPIKGDSNAAVLTAHHADDQLETRMLHLMRGGSLRGFSGMALRSDERGYPLVRPLLDLTRADLIASLKADNLSWREDASNNDPHYLRSRIRHELLPLMRDIRPGFEAPFARLAVLVAEAHGTALPTLAPLHELLEKGAHIPLHLFTDSPTPHLAADAVTRHTGLGAKNIEPLLKLVRREAHTSLQSPTHRLTVKGNQLEILKLLAPQAETLNKNAPEANAHLTWNTTSDWTIDRAVSTAQLDGEQLDWPLLLRTWKAGDRFHPLGMEGSKKVSDLLNQRGCSAEQKAATLVLESAGKIAWVVGVRISAEFAITTQTRSVTTFTRKTSQDLAAE